MGKLKFKDCKSISKITQPVGGTVSQDLVSVPALITPYFGPQSLHEPMTVRWFHLSQLASKHLLSTCCVPDTGHNSEQNRTLVEFPVH